MSSNNSILMLVIISKLPYCCFMYGETQLHYLDL
uniref:Uncharacterized protein n=1 Tax=Anguilla anguilla TaxID=7936 RepID=A0A0E9QS62_ANGAN